MQKIETREPNTLEADLPLSFREAVDALKIRFPIGDRRKGKD
jgi:hypothetical protein